MKTTANGNQPDRAAQPLPPRPLLSSTMPGAQGQQPQATQPTQAQQIAQLALTFLQRTQLQGAELDAFATVRGWLTAIAQGQLLVLDAPPAGGMAALNGNAGNGQQAQ